MNEFTKVGPPDKNDRSRKIRRLIEAILRGPSWISLPNPIFMRAWLMFRKSRELEEGAESNAAGAAWHGLPRPSLAKSKSSAP